MVTKWVFSKNANLSVFKSVFVPILSCGHESYMRTERILSKEQRQRWDICEEFSVWHCVTTKTTGLKSQARDVKPLLRIERSPAMVVRPCFQDIPGKNSELSPWGYSLHPQKSGPKFVQGPGGVTTSLTLLGTVLVWSQQKYLRLLLIVRSFESS